MCNDQLPGIMPWFIAFYNSHGVNTAVPLYLQFHVLRFSYLRSTEVPEVDDPLSDESAEGVEWPDVTSRCLHHSLASSHHTGVLSSHIIMRRVSTVQIRYLERETAFT